MVAELAALKAVYADAIARELARLGAAHRARPPVRREDYGALEAAERHLNDGCERLRRFLEALQFLQQHAKLRLGHHQVKLMRAIRAAAVKKIFGDQLVNNLEYLRVTYSITDIRDVVAILFPRRSGKTVTQAIAAACFAVSQPDANIVCFNILGRQARAWLKQVMQYLAAFARSPQFGFTVVQRDLNEFITVRAFAAGTDNTISAFPGGKGANFDNLRGMGVKLFGIFMDEGCFMDEAIVEVTMPLLKTGAFLVITSSVGDKGARSGVMCIVDGTYKDGTRIVNELNFIAACDACVARKVENKCRHVIQQPQFFESDSNNEKIGGLMQSREGAYAREVLNESERPLVLPAFSHEWVALLNDRARDVTIAHGVPCVYTSVDPAGGGFSRMALVSLIESGGKVVIVGGEFIVTEIGHEIGAAVAKHIHALRMLHSLRGAHFVINVEANMSFAAPDVEYYFRTHRDELPPFSFIREDHRPNQMRDGEGVVSVGTRTTAQNKPGMIDAVRVLLSQARLVFHRNFVSEETENRAPESADVRATIIKELQTYVREISYPRTRTLYSRAVQKFRSAGGNDRNDFVMAIAIATRSIEVFRTDPRYRRSLAY